jgi:hypothetical protein
MRVQTFFGRIAGSTNEQFFGLALVLLRVTFGVEMFMIGYAGGDFPVLYMIVGICFMLGILLRPAAVAGLALLLVSTFMTSPEALKNTWFIYLGLMAIALLALPGGLGHSLGLNGLVMRNIRYPKTLARLLFG